MLHLIRGLLNLRTQHPVLANGDLGAILTDSPDWAVFEKVEGSDAYLVLINMSGHGNSYHFHDAWYPHWRQTELICWSDGRLKKWKNVTGEAAQIEDAVYVPPYGLVVLRARA